MGGRRPTLNRLAAAVLFILFSPIILLFFIPLVLHFIIRSIGLGFLVNIKWISQGKNTLFVYSQSPVWKDYIEKNIIPKISSSSTIMNWSERTSFNKWSLEYKVFAHWTQVHQYSFNGKTKWSGAEYNPVAIVFKPWWNPKVLRFWEAFRDYKHGKDQKLKELENTLYNLLGRS